MKRSTKLWSALGVLCLLAPGCAGDDATRDADTDLREDVGVDSGASQCGEHGVFHRDHCHCDTGYTEEEGVCVAIPQCTLSDEHEPNNRMSDATQARVVSGGELLWDAAICPGDVDYYSVQLDEPRGVSLKLESGEGRLNLSLYRPGDDPRFAGSFIEIAPRDSSFERDIELSMAGSWLVAVRGREAASQFEYTLRVDAGVSDADEGGSDE